LKGSKIDFLRPFAPPNKFRFSALTHPADFYTFSVHFSGV